MSMWRPEINSLVSIRHPNPDMAAMIARQSKDPEKKVLFRVEALTDYPDGGIEATLQPEFGCHPLGTKHTIYTSWLIPA